MGRTVDVYVYDFDKLRQALIEKGCTEPKLTEILVEFGTVICDKYILVNNELFEDGNTYYLLPIILDEVFDIANSFDTFLSSEYRDEAISYYDSGIAFEKFEVVEGD